MCIRDRRNTLREAFRMLSQERLVVHRLNRGVFVRELTVAAVSYTHLRAHETVLDIVCRLLLEKQQKKKNNKHLAVHEYNKQCE